MTTLCSDAKPLASICSAAEIAVPLPMATIYTYKIPPELEAKVKKGVRVQVPFKNREIVGYVVDRKNASETAKLKSILEVLDEEPVLSQGMLELTHWIADFYGSSWGEAIENALPKWVKYGKKAERALAKEEAVAVISQECHPERSEGSKSEILRSRKSLPQDDTQKEALTLSADQKEAFAVIAKSLDEPNPKPILLFGVTGSGKSELYIRAIREVLKKNRAAICLVPEIALTEQLRRFFLHHFGSELEILHSKLGDSERFLAWKRLERGEKKVILGPRSAVFAPVPNLGLLIMDEEHEGSYKQETNPRYHAREVAYWRAKHDGILFIMGTATPSLETMRRTEIGEVLKIDLKTRIDDKAMPKVEIIDLKNTDQTRKSGVILTSRLASEIDLNLKKKQGTILLLNRRGFSTHIHCPRCGQVESCQSCQVSLTFHQEDGKLRCHYCNFEKPVAGTCSNCKSPLLRFAGFGTEKVESEVAARFPAARIARLDADSVKKKGSHEIILKDFRDRKIDILIGTQMIAKGFDFPHVTLVGVVLADVGLMLPDFRSAERTFQLLTQVAGRAGRGEIPGRVLIQTYSPDHPSILFAKNHDFPNFYRHEIQSRHEYKYPPYQRLINIIIRSKNEKEAYLFSRTLRDGMVKEYADTLAAKRIEIIGPAPLPFYRLRGHFRWHVLVKRPTGGEPIAKLSAFLSKLKKPSHVAFAIDVDPLNIL